jgi:hypothetical protein
MPELSPKPELSPAEVYIQDLLTRVRNARQNRSKTNPNLNQAESYTQIDTPTTTEEAIRLALLDKTIDARKQSLSEKDMQEPMTAYAPGGQLVEMNAADFERVAIGYTLKFYYKEVATAANNATDPLSFKEEMDKVSKEADALIATGVSAHQLFNDYTLEREKMLQDMGLLPKKEDFSKVFQLLTDSGLYIFTEPLKYEDIPPINLPQEKPKFIPGEEYGDLISYLKKSSSLPLIPYTPRLRKPLNKKPINNQDKKETPKKPDKKTII